MANRAGRIANDLHFPSRKSRGDEMDSMRKTVGLAAVFMLLFELAAWAGLGSKKTMYVGGTIASVKQGTEGESSTQDEKVFAFNYKDGQLKIPYDRINDLEYG